MVRVLAIGLAVCLSARVVAAQVVIQQPVVRVQGVNTAVSVPDRGNALLGSVSRGAEAGNFYGPLPYGTSTGRSYERASQRVSVTIHDFEEMDQLLLNAAAARRAGFEWSHIPARDAWTRSYDGTVGDEIAISNSSSTSSPDVAGESPPSPAPDVTASPQTTRDVAPTRPRQRVIRTQADRLLALGDRALADEKIGDALGFYRGAAILGSAEAETLIRDILARSR